MFKIKPDPKFSRIFKKNSFCEEIKLYFSLQKPKIHSQFYLSEEPAGFLELVSLVTWLIYLFFFLEQWVVGRVLFYALITFLFVLIFYRYVFSSFILGASQHGIRFCMICFN